MHRNWIFMSLLFRKLSDFSSDPTLVRYLRHKFSYKKTKVTLLGNPKGNIMEIGIFGSPILKISEFSSGHDLRSKIEIHLSKWAKLTLLGKSNHVQKYEQEFLFTLEMCTADFRKMEQSIFFIFASRPGFSVFVSSQKKKKLILPICLPC